MALTKPRAYQIYDIDYKQAVRVVSISNVTLAGGAPNSVDGVTLSLNDRVLVTGQTSGVQNGIYYVTTLGSGANGTWTRSTDTDATGELLSGTIVMVTEGTAYADTQWKLTTNDPITIGSTALTFVQNYLANSISFGQTSFAIGSSNANATISVAGTSNVAVFATDGEYVTGLISASGNITSAGNVQGGNLIGTIATPGQTNITGVGNITTGTWSANAVGLAYGGTGKTSAPAAMAALMGYTSTVTAAGTTTLTNTSSYYQQFTGSTTQTVVLPVTSTLTTGWTFHIVNNSTGSVTVQSSGLNTVITVIAGTTAMVTCIGTALTTAADWESGITDFSTYTGSGSVVMSASPSLSGTTSVSALSASSTLNLTGSTTSTTSLGTSATTGTTTIGGTAQTGALNLGRSTVSQTIAIGNGVTASGSTKTIDIGTLGAANSITNINIGPTAGNSTVSFLSNAQVSIANTGGAALSVVGNITGGNINTAGKLVSTLANGTAPMLITSTTKVVNLNVELVDGYHADTANIVSTIAVRDAAGNITAANYNGTGVSVSGNINGGNLIVTGIIVDNIGNLDLQTTATNGNINLIPAGTGNVYTGANLIVTGQVSSGGNITGGNIVGSTVSATGTTTGYGITAAGVSTGTALLAASGRSSGAQGALLYLGGNSNPSSSAAYLMNGQHTLSPQVDLSSWYGMLFLPTVSTFAGNIGSMYSQFLRVDTSATGNSNITNWYGTYVATPSFAVGSAPVLQNWTGFYVQDPNNAVANATAAYGYRSTINRGANRWGAYFSGTANSYFAGNIGIGVISAGNALDVSGTIYVSSGNILTSGLISATGNITSAGNISGSYILGNGSQLTGLPATYANANVAAYLASGSDTSNIITTANVSGGNVLATTIVSGASHIGSIVSVSANITGGNLITSGLISATGNIIGNRIAVAAGSAAAPSVQFSNDTAADTGFYWISDGNIGVTTNGTLRVTFDNAGGVSATGNVTGGNLLTAGIASVTGTITTAGGTNSTGFAVGNGAVSNVGLGFFPTAGTKADMAIRDYSTVASSIYLDVGMGGTAAGDFQFRTTNSYTSLATINSTGIRTPLAVSATGIVYGLEITSTQSSGDEGGQLNLAKPATNSTLGGSVTVDINQNRLRFFENGGTNRGAYIDLTSTGTGVSTNLLAGAVAGSNTYVQFNDGGGFGGNGQFVYDKVNNLVTAGAFAGNTNGTGQNFKVGDDAWIGDINQSDTVGIKGQQNSANAYIVFGNSDSTGKLGRAGTGPLTYAGAFSATANVTGGNLLTAGLISSTGNITSAANVAGGNVLATTIVSGASHIGSIVSVSSNVTGGNLLTAGLISAASHIGSVVSVSANITGGNLLTGGIISATGNVSGGNVAAATAIFSLGTVGASGNISGGNVLATTIVSGASHIGSIVSVSANVTGGNLITAGLVSTPIVTGSTLTVSATGGAITLSPSSNVSVSSKYINNLADPVQNQDAATKAYVDNFATTAIAYHTPVSVATTTTLASTTGGTITYAQPNGVANGIGATITTTGSFNLIDTVSVQTANTRILVKDEANGVTNGVYVWSNATVITRATDADEYGADSASTFSINDYFFVQNGNVNKGSAYLTSAPTGTITFGTSNIQFAQFSSSQTYTANTSAGISLVGTVINAKVDNLTTAFDGSGNISVKTSAQLTTPNIGAATGTSVSVTGNVTGGNLTTGGQVTATGNVTSAANVSGGNLLATTTVSAASHIGTIVSVTANVTGGNILTGGLISATSNITSAANVSGGNLLATTTVSAASHIGSVVSVSGNITGGNVLATTIVSGASHIGSIVSVSGNITGGNLNTGAQVVATGNITGGNILTAGQVSATGNVSGGNLNVTGNIVDSGALTIITGSNGNIALAPNGTGIVTSSSALSATGNITSAANVSGGNVLATTIVSGASHIGSIVSVTANITGGNVLTGGLISATSNITSAANVAGGNLLATTTVSAASHIGSIVSVSANITGGNVLTGGLISATGNITGGNLNTGAQVVATGNITGGNILTAGLVSATGNVSGGNLNVTGNIVDTGALTIITGSNGNIALAPNGTGIVTASGNISAVGNISGSYILGNGSQLTGLPATYANANVAAYLASGTDTSNIITTANVSGGNILATTIVSGASLLGSIVSVSANVTGGNLLTAGLVSATGNITGGNANIIGTTASTSRTTGALKVAGGIGVAGDLYAGNSVVVDGGAYGNVVTTQFASLYATGAGANPYSIVQVRSNDGTTGMGMQAYANLNGLVYSNSGITFQTGATIRDKDFPTGGTTRATIDSTGLSVTGLVSASGNITGANIVTSGSVSTVGNLYAGTANAGYVFGNATFMTGISAAISVTKIENGNSNVWVNTPGGDVTVTAGGVSNVAVFSTGSLTLQGAFGTPKTITANIIVAGNINAMLIGPLTFGDGYGLTVPTSSTVYVYSPNG